MASVKFIAVLLLCSVYTIYKCQGYQSGGWVTQEEADYYCIKTESVYGQTAYSCSQKSGDKVSSIEEARSSCIRYYQVRNNPRWACT